MPTYTIVDTNKDPLGPGEINAGVAITVSPGDVFIIDPSANSNITFVSPGGGPHDFDIVFNGGNANTFKLITQADLTPSVTVAGNANLSNVDIDAAASKGLTLVVGDNASMGKLDGSKAAADNITIGNGFTATGDWKTDGGNDVLNVGDGAKFRNLVTGTGDDTVTFGDAARFIEIDTDDGNDSISLGDNAVGKKIKAGAGDDNVRTADREQVTTVDGAGGSDSYTTQTRGTKPSNMETITLVCYAPGTLIMTAGGARAVETLRPGDQVLTADYGAQPIRWVRSGDCPLDGVGEEVKPVLIQAGALGPGLPAQDLILSPQHRIPVGGGGQLITCFEDEVFAPAKGLTRLPGIRHMNGKTKITWIHFACDRHEVVTTNGCLSESLLLGPMAVAGLTRAQRQEVSAIFGAFEAADTALNGPARPYLPDGAANTSKAGRLREKETPGTGQGPSQMAGGRRDGATRARPLGGQATARRAIARHPYTMERGAFGLRLR